MKTQSTQLHFSSLRTLLLSFLFAWGLTSFSHAQYRVGTGSGATHTTLMAAYADVQSAGLPSNFTIEICAGTYLNQPLLLTPISIATPGARLTIKGMTSNPCDALFRITDPAQRYALKLAGADNITFENIMFDIEDHSSRTNANPVWSTEFSSGIRFSNCLMEGPVNVLSSGSDWKYSLVFLEEFDGDTRLTDCCFNDGTVGITARQTSLGSSTPLLTVRRCRFAEQSRIGIDIHDIFRGQKALLRDNYFTSATPYQYTGIDCAGIGGELDARDNTVFIGGKSTTRGIVSAASKSFVRDNTLVFIDCERLIAIHVNGEANDVVIDGNEIYEEFFTISMSGILNEGIVFEGAYPDGFKTHQFIEITNNSHESQTPYLGHGIQVILHGRKVQSLLNISGNEILYDNLKSAYIVEFDGIVVEGNGTEVKNTRINDNSVHFEENYTGSIWAVTTGISVDDLTRSNLFEVFNNRIELGKQGQPGGRGISVSKIWDALGLPPFTPVWIGNNMVSMENSINNDVFGIAVEDIKRTRVYHNSVHIRDEEPSSTNYPGIAAFFVGESTSGSMTDLQVLNNIWSNISHGLNAQIECASCLVGSDNNLYVPYNKFRLRSPLSLSTFTDLSTWQASSGLDINSLNANPLFTSGDDLHIQIGSPAINQGSWLSYPPTDITLQQDIDGDSRNSGDIPDIGADEYVGSTKWASDNAAAPASDWEVFPNPTTGWTTLRGTDGDKVDLVDPQGRSLQSHILTGKTLQLDLRTLPAGIYLLRLQRSGQAPQVRKLILQ